MSNDFSTLLEEIACTLVVGGSGSAEDVAGLRSSLAALEESLPSGAPQALRDAMRDCRSKADADASSADAWLAEVVESFAKVQAIHTSEVIPPPPPAAPTEGGRAAALGLPEWVDEELLADFISSQQMALEEIEGILLAIESGEDTDVRELKGQLHSLKGESGTVGLDDLQHVYHAWEDLLDRDLPPETLAEMMLKAQDWVVGAMAAYAAGQHPAKGPEDILGELSEGIESGQAQEYIERDEEMVALLGEFHEESMDGITRTDELLLEAENGGLDQEGINAIFRVFHTIKGVAGFVEQPLIAELAHNTENLLIEVREGRIVMEGHVLDLVFEATGLMRRMLVESQEAVANSLTVTQPAELKPLINSLAFAVEGVELALPPKVEAKEETPAAESASVASPAGGSTKSAAPPAASKGKKTAIKETIKVDLARVDSLVELIGELVIVETMVANAPEITSLRSHRVRNFLGQLNKIIRDLQRQGLGLRMVPLKGVFQKMSRLVRDLSKRNGKKVNLVISGETTEMDRSLVEQIGDPLVHMVRNSMDHGLENAEERVAAGKDPKGTVTLSAYHEGGNIIIAISDDGRGLDREKITAKAVSRGILSADAAASLSDREAYELIFAPGFSTAEKVTEISGRGVGMDVVKRSIESMRGRIRIESTLGQGTTFQMVMPLTLAIIDGMLLSCGQSRYVLPTLSIMESVQPAEDMIRRFADRAPMLHLRGEIMPLVHLGNTLGEMTAKQDPVDGLVVIVEGTRGRYGLVVDEVLGQQQVVIKNLGEGLNNAELFSGAAILSTGKVGLILNPSALDAETQVGALPAAIYDDTNFFEEMAG